MSIICSKMAIFLFSAYFGGHFCYHSNRKSRINARLLHFGYCSKKLVKSNFYFLTSKGGGGKIAYKCTYPFEPRREISNNAICATSKASDQPAQTRRLIRTFTTRLKYSMSVKLLTEYHLEFLRLTGGCTGSSESTLVKIPHCWKSHVTAQLCHYIYLLVFTVNSKTA